MALCNCESCGMPVLWSWEDAFMHAHPETDGNGYLQTFHVKRLLMADGYIAEMSVKENPYYHMISSLKKPQGQELLPLSSNKFYYGYDNPRDYLPKDVISLLDKTFG